VVRGIPASHMTGSSVGQPDQPQSEGLAGGSAVRSTRSKGLEIKLSDIVATNATLNGNYLR